MRKALPLALAAYGLAMAQSGAPAPEWRNSLSALPANPPTNTTPQDVQLFEKNMRLAASYLGTGRQSPSPAQWQANRDLVRRMATYVYALQALSNSNPKLRGATSSAQRSFNSLGFAPYLAFPVSVYPAAQQDDQQGQPLPPAQPVQGMPPFDLAAPDMQPPSDADKEMAKDLRNRYETDAAYSAGVWQNAEVLRQNLEAQGMGLNIQTSAAMMRLPQQYRSAAADLRNGDWESARTHLEQAEAITQRIAKTVGQ